MTHIMKANTNLVILIAFLAIPALLFADPIVIDSGTDETVISRLPSAPGQEEPVCSDEADGTLGPCSSIGSGLVFYETESTSANIPLGDFELFVSVSCDSGDVMMGPASLALQNLAVPFFDLNAWSYERPDSESLRFFFQIFDTCEHSVGCFVASNLKGLCLDATP